MLKRSSKLRFFKWAGLVGCVVLVGAWISNLWWNYGVVAWGASFDFGVGCTGLGSNDTGSYESHFYVFHGRGILWLPRVLDTPYRTTVLIPNWMLLAVLLPLTTWLWRRDRRIPPGHCKSCGYNLTGNISGRCPEYGEQFDEKVTEP